ncbi:MAG TPA: kelch repeat-containing protein [Candidatus Nanopelagicaceae bacterium]|nr:kelch repeat-containing protein [Candidatus Nanopelagicaceae bacterium]
MDDTWIFDPSNNQWTEVIPSSSPANRFHTSLIYVPDTEKNIVFSGFRFPANCLGDTWCYDYDTNIWNQLK